MKKKFQDAQVKINETKFVAMRKVGASHDYGGIIVSEQRLYVANKGTFKNTMLICGSQDHFKKDCPQLSNLFLLFVEKRKSFGKKMLRYTNKHVEMSGMVKKR